MTFEAALAYLYAHEDRERLGAGVPQAEAFDLRRVNALLHALGDPHHNRLTVHIAGTKGKGSVAAMVASVLSTSGQRTGLYTSPHLCDFRERIRVDGAAISPDAFARVVERVKDAAEHYHQEPRFGHLTTFELTTAAAFLHFRDEGATAQVLETGLGGRLDATNLVPTPDIAIITPISYDHTQVLGATLAAIAGEKAGIIKEGGVVVMAPQEPEAEAVIARRCYQAGAKLVDVRRRGQWRRLEPDLDGQSFHVQVPSLGLQDTQQDSLGKVGLGLSLDLRIPLLGEFQVENAATAIAALEVLRERGVTLRREDLESGLAGACWPGRMQVIRREPLIILDGAHNGESARRLREALSADIPHRRLVLIVGLSADKDLAAFAAELGPIADQVIATRASGARSADPAQVAYAFKACRPGPLDARPKNGGAGFHPAQTGWKPVLPRSDGHWPASLSRGLPAGPGSAGILPAVAEAGDKPPRYEVLTTRDLAVALDLAMPLLSPDDALCITGSLYLVGDALRHFGLADTVLNLVPQVAIGVSLNGGTP